MQLCLIVLFVVLIIFLIYIYKDTRDRKFLEKITRPSDFLKIKGFFQKDDPSGYNNALFQGGLATQISHLRFDEPSYTDGVSRFNGTLLSSNQAIIIKGSHQLKYLSLTVLDERETKIDTFVPKENDKFAFIVLRSKSLKSVLEKKLKGFDKYYTFVSDLYHNSNKISIVAEYILDKTNANSSSFSCEKCTLIGVENRVTSMNLREPFELKVTEFSPLKFKSVFYGSVLKDHSIEGIVTLDSELGKFGNVFRQVSRGIEFNQNTYIKVLTTKRKDDLVQLGIVDNQNRVIYSSNVGEYHAESHESLENIVEIKILPRITGFYRIFTAHFSREDPIKPLTVAINGKVYGKLLKL